MIERDLICRAVIAAIKKVGTSDPISLAEAVADRIEFALELASTEEGIMPVSRSMQDEILSPVAQRKVSVVSPPPSTHSVGPVPGEERAKGLIITKDSPEFAATLEGKDVGRQKNVVLAAGSIRRPVAANRSQPSRPLWDPASLIEQINENTPNTITFEVLDREGEVRKLTVEKNITTSVGPTGTETITLSYKHPAVEGDNNMLLARHVFTVFDKEIRITEALQQIQENLPVIYRARPQEMNPMVGPEPGPLRVESRGQLSDTYGSKFEPGMGQSADPFTQVQGKLTELGLRAVIDQATANQRLTPADTPLMRRTPQ